MKRFMLFAISIIVVILIGLVIMNQNKVVSSDNSLIEEPDKILIYHNNKIIEIKSDNDEFYKIFDLVCKRINSKSFFGETAIEDKIVDEVKADFAIELIYFKEQILYFKEFSRPYKRLFISLSEKYDDYIVIYAEDSYQSSPLENLNKSNQLKKYVDKIIRK